MAEHRGPSRRDLLRGGVGLTAVAAAGAWTAPVSGQVRAQPNIVLIMLDDMGYGDLSLNGSGRISTPRIDSVGSAGMTCEQVYAAPVCTPARASLLTGRHSQRVGLPAVLGPNSRLGLSAYEQTVAEVLRDAGYRTGIFGKWHLGNPANRAELSPLSHGFDTCFGVPYSNDMEPLPLYDGRQIVDPDVDDQEQVALTGRYTDEAINFIRNNRDRPFFAYLPHSAPHVPFHVEERFQGSSQAGAYGDIVQQADFHIGRVLDELDRLGLTDTTLVIVTSDNGAGPGGTTGGLRGRKGSTFEGGVRVPLMARWPGQIRAGSRTAQPIGFTDIMPTLAAIGGGRVPGDRPIDGIDIRPVLQGGTVPRRPFYHFNGWALRAVRSGPWKLHVSRPDPTPDLPLLYNLDTDRAETANVAAQNPDVVERLSNLAEQFAQEIAEQRPEAERRARGEA